MTAKRILVVERSTSLRNLLVTLLRGYALAVETAADEVHAAQLLKMFPYDLIVLDLSLPDMRLVTDDLRASAKRIPIIAFTPDECLPEEVSVDGATVMQKPFEVHVFRALVERALGIEG